MKQYIMAFDQGTTSSRCILFDRQGRMVSIAQREFEQIYPKPGWVEHNPMEIWSSQVGVATEAMAMIGAKASEIEAIGITNQRETTIVWDKRTGRPIYNAIVWQCRRTAQMVDELKSTEIGSKVPQLTGLIPDAYFSATKIAWILDHVDGARKKAEAGELLFGTVDTWLIWNLTKGKTHVTDYTNASRTMLFNIRELTWEQELLDYFRIPRAMLPEVRPSSCVYGIADHSILGGDIPIAGAAGDQQAALFGQCCFRPGEVKNTYGTGCFLLMHTGDTIVSSDHGLLTTIAASTEEKVEYALEGSVFVAGSAIQWLRDGLRMIKDAPSSQYYAEQVVDNNGMYIVPAFTGMGAPYWNPYARGVVTGITRGCRKEHFVRATLESIAYQVMDVLFAMEGDAGIPITNLKVDGGASANEFLLQFQADIIDRNVYRPECIETTALGAAYLAGLATGFFTSKEEIQKNWRLNREFQPQMEPSIRERLKKDWRKAVRCALIWAEE